MAPILQEPREGPSSRILRLAMIEVSAKRYVPASVRHQATWSSWEDLHLPTLTTNLVVELSARVLADQTVDRDRTFTTKVSHEEYASWWQHTKAVHFPTLSRWLDRPPRMRTVEQTASVTVNFRQWVTFPEADIYPTEFGKSVLYEDWGQRR
jgi:hypothetical protein